MANLTSGLQIMHNMKPMELLYQTHKLQDGAEIWMVKTLFIDEQEERHEIFNKGDTCTTLHGAKQVKV